MQDKINCLKNVTFCSEITNNHCKIVQGLSNDYLDLKHFKLQIFSFNCPFCDFCTEDHEDFQDHWSLKSQSRHLNDVKYKLNLESEGVYLLEALNQGDLDEESFEENIVFHCYSCSENRCSLLSLYMHFTDNHKELEFDVKKITVTRLQLDLRNSLAVQEESLSPNKRIDNVMLTCPVCPQFWTNDYARLERHNKSKQHLEQFQNHYGALPEVIDGQNSSIDKHRCEICNFETKYSFNLNQHYKSLKHLANITTVWFFKDLAF